MLYICFGCMRGLLGTAAVKTHWKSVAALAFIKEPSAESVKKLKKEEQRCCTSIFSLPSCVSAKCGLVRVDTIPRTKLFDDAFGDS